MKELYSYDAGNSGKKFANAPQSYCEECFSPLEVSYDYEALAHVAHRGALAHRAFNMWRYAELLPLPEGFTPTVSHRGTPLVKSRKLGARWGVQNVYFKNDAVCFPTLSTSRTALWEPLSPQRAASASRRSVVLQPAISPTPSPRKAHNSDSIPASSFPPISSPRKS